MRKLSQPVALILMLGALWGISMGADPNPETAIPGIAPLPKSSIMTQDELSEFFQRQKKGTPMQLTISKDKIVNGLFSSFDEYYETVWLVPQGEKGLFTTKGYRLSGIHSAALWDRKVASGLPHNVDEAANQDYYLLKDSGIK